MGSIFGLNRSTACTLSHQYIDILLDALKKAGVVPKEKFKNRNEFIIEFPDLKVVITNGTKRRRRRPKNKDYQKEFYPLAKFQSYRSGKKIPFYEGDNRN